MISGRCIFPTELICHILSHTAPRDIIRWRTVSKWFRTITYDGMLWKALCANAPFPCPGPFPSQSNASVERMLVRSARLAQSWTTRPMRDVSSVNRNPKPGVMHSVSPILICGRWHLVYERGGRFVLYDADAGTETSRLQVLEENARVLDWDVCSMVSAEGQCVVYVALHLDVTDENGNGYLRGCHKLSEFRLDDESGELYNSAAMVIPVNRRVGLRGGKGKSPFFFISAYPEDLVFDMRTRVLYKLPKFRVALNKTRGKTAISGDMPLNRQMATSSDIHHIIRCHSYPTTANRQTVIQVFTLPPDGPPVENGNPILRLTHEGVADWRILNAEVLKLSVDPVTEATIVTLLDHPTYLRNPEVTRIDLTLPKLSVVDVLPMTVEIYHISFPMDEMPTGYNHCFQYVDVSDDRHVRGFHWKPSRYCSIDNPYFKSDHIAKFTIDTTQDQWVLACGKLSPAQWSHIERLLFNEPITFDGMRGKLYFRTNYETIVVVDIE